MVTTEKDLEEQAESLERSLERATETAIDEAQRLPDDAGEPQLDDDFTRKQEKRILLTIGTTVTAAAMMVGGIFFGVTPRIEAAIAGILGIIVASRASRSKSAWQIYVWVLAGVFAIGLLLAASSGLGVLPNLSKELRTSLHQGSLLRPPVIFQPGWRAILGWVMGSVGFAAAWTATELKRPAMGLMLPVPVVAFGAISVPKDQQLITGLACLVLLAAGLALLSGLHERGAEDEAPSLAYEMRRFLKAIPVVAVVIALLIVAKQFNFLFPHPLYDPTEKPRHPQSQPLDEVKDRVLFEVKAPFTGPWKLGSLDVYDGKDWLLPPYSEKNVHPVPTTGVDSGVVDRSLTPAVAAEFTVRGLTGAVLPGLANTVGITGKIPNDMRLSYDQRAGVVRVVQGQFRAGFQYTIVSAGIPRIDQLRAEPRDLPDGVKSFLTIPGAPDAVRALLRQASDKKNLWDRLDYVRHQLLNTVSASGNGVPKSVTPARVQEMLTSNPEATPFEIVAAQAMLARWVGVPSRIGYGFDRGDPGPVKDTLLIRPRNGAVYLEVFFKDFGWLPIIGDPLKAKINLDNADQQFNPNLSASDDVSINLFVPELTVPRGELFRSVRNILGIVIPAALLMLMLYLLWPFPYKAVRRARRRTWAVRRGPAARVALAYAEWRDAVTDYGYQYISDPPLLFLSRFSPDEEHVEFAWLVTRVLWGDLQHRVSVDEAVAAEALSAALRQRLSRAHPWTLRAVATLSRLSIRKPYAPHLGDVMNGARKSEVSHAA